MQVLKLRDLLLCDRAVLAAYGWTDIATDCEFRLDYEEEESNSKRKKPWRYRWNETTHDEVLARLLELNRQRAATESLLGTAATKPKAKGSKHKAPPPKTKSQLPTAD